MGWFFLITGILIAGYGSLIADPIIYTQRSLGYNVNLYWGHRTRDLWRRLSLFQNQAGCTKISESCDPP